MNHETQARDKAHFLERVSREMDDDLKPLSGGRANPGVRFHVWIYRKRPDVKDIIHTHAPFASALAATGTPLKTIHQPRRCQS